jgi:acyl carrier protein
MLNSQCLLLASPLPLQVDMLQMHGTGTSLGDPIEVGAAAAVLGRPRTTSSSSPPLALFTSKSSMGHAEPAAGVVGILHSMTALRHMAVPPLLHLRSPNPFVAGALDGAGGFHLPRVMAPRGSLTSDAQLVSGVSSFAFQGTNAHLVLMTAPTDPLAAGHSSSASARVPWQPGRHWFMAPVNPLVTRVHQVTRSLGVRGAAGVHMVSQLAAPGLSALLGCSAQQMQGPILPAGALLTMAAAAADVVGGAASLNGQVLLTQAVLNINSFGGVQPSGLQVSLDVNLRVGEVQLTCSQGVILLAASVHAMGSAIISSTAAASQAALAANLPPWLAELGAQAMVMHDQVPSQPIKCQVAPGAPHLEPAVAAACQLEAALQLPAAAAAVAPSSPQVLSALASAILAPRGSSSPHGLELVDPDEAEEGARGQVPAARRSSFWLSDPQQGLMMQLRGAAFRSMLQPQAPMAVPAAAAAAVATTSAATEPARPAPVAAIPVAAAGLQARGMNFAPLGAATPSLAPPPAVAAAAAAAAATVAVEPAGSEAVSSPGVAADVEEVLDEDCYYTRSWVAVASGSATSPQPLEAAAVHIQGSQNSTPLASSVLAGMAVLQQAAAADTAHPSVQLATVGAAYGSIATPCGVPTSSDLSSAAAAWAIMRPLALEQADWGLTAADVDGASAAGSHAGVQYTLGAAAAAPAAPLTPDLYGSTCSGGVHYAAQLQLAHPSTAAQAQVLPQLSPAVAGSALQLGLQLAGRHIITGGSGAVAVQVARWLADQEHVHHVQLVSRSGALPAGVADIALGSSSSSSRAVAITSTKADVSFTEDVGLVFSSGVHPVVGVYHAAGVLSDALLSNQTPSSIRSVLAAKTAGLQAMQQQLSLQPVSQQVLFSSVAALLGSPGQSNYAAANAALDAAAAASSCMGLPALSIQYGAWAGAGMAARDQQTAARAARLGLPLLQPSQALAALRLASAAAPVVAAVRITWPVFLSHMRQPRGAFFEAFSSYMAAQEPPALPAAPPETPAAPAAGVDAGEVEQQVREAVAEAVETLLGGPVPAEEPLMAAGLDSLGAVELRNMLQESLGAQLPNTLVLDYPTQQALTVHITQQLVQTMPSPTATTAAAAAATATAIAAEVPSPQVQLARPVPVSAAAAPLKEVLMVLAAAQRRPGQQVSAFSAEQELLLGSSSGSRSDAINMVPLERWDSETSISSTAARCVLTVSCDGRTTAMSAAIL